MNQRTEDSGQKTANPDWLLLTVLWLLSSVLWSEATMADTTKTVPGPTPGFPFATVLATLATFFLFAGLVVVAYNSPNYLGETKTEPKADPSAKLAEVRAKNQAALDGNDPKMKTPLAKAMAEILTIAEKDKALPFPIEKKAEPKAPDAKAK